MKRHLLPLQLLLGLFLFAAGLSAQPVNDNCANAIPIGLTNNLAFSTLDATTDGPNHPNDCVSSGTTGDSLGADIWYAFTANYDGFALFTLCGTAVFDSKIAVYGPGFSCPPTDAQIIACNEDGAGCANSTSKTTFEVVNGETYLLRLGGWVQDGTIHSGSGTFSVEVFDPLPGPPNDLCANAIELVLDANDSTHIDFTTVNANTDGPVQPNVPFYCFDEDETTVFHDIWYKWTATFSAWVEWSDCGTSSLDSRISVYGPDQSCPPDPTALVGCGDDGIDVNGQNCNGFTSRVFFPVEEGKEYLFHYGGWSDSDEGTGTITFKRIPTPTLPPNDHCAEPDSAFVMTALQADEFEFLFQSTTINGSPDGVASPTCLPTGEFSDVWYTFNSGTNTEIELRFNTVTFGASFIIDLFQTDCQTPVDPLLIDFCLQTADFPNSAFNETITGFPGTPTEYLLRVATKITDTSPGEFFFQLVGTPYDPNGVEATTLTQFKFAPNPVSGNANVRFTLTEQAEVSASIENVLGQQVLRRSFGEIQGEQSLDLPLGELESGVYFLRLSAGNSFRSIKFVKE